MATLKDILTAQLRALGVIFQGEVPDASKILNALDAQNLMLGSMSDSLVYASVSEDLVLTPGKASYTIGTSGTPDFNTTRPTNIKDQCYIRDTLNDIDYPLMIIGEAEYNAINLKDTQSIPEALFYDPQYPLGILYFYYVPDMAYTLHLVSDKPMTAMTVADLTATISLPPEYMAFLKWNGAVASAPDYPGSAAQPGFQIVMREAQRSLSIIQRINAANKVERANLDTPGIRRNVDNRALFRAGRTD